VVKSKKLPKRGEMRSAVVFIFVSAVAFAQMIDGLAAIVNGKPITLYEIQKTARQKRISPQLALETLIRKELEKEQIAKLKISVSDTELEQELDRFARNLGLDYFGLKERIEADGIDWQEYKKRAKEKLLRKKLFDKILMSQNQPTQQEIREYYNNHPEEFSVAQKASVIKYISPYKEILERVRQNPLYQPPDPEVLLVASQELKLPSLNPMLSTIINQTPPGSFTPILPLPQNRGYLVMLVKSKEGQKQIPFEQASYYILQKLSTKNGKKTIKEYFDKLRASADVKIIRLPKE
jgi:parvulin-like peptidyl-prolyl isomerase